jgi:hypothetical protein
VNCPRRAVPEPAQADQRCFKYKSTQSQANSRPGRGTTANPRSYLRKRPEHPAPEGYHPDGGFRQENRLLSGNYSDNDSLQTKPYSLIWGNFQSSVLIREAPYG